ncbi:MAG: hypothetical protein PHF86_04060 [Candidatus Nanoarchaeia archaeon]|jgi:hypothetical protein|nr:hypothetical protein [Candidatus Nanoarchaeia archaeon]
MTENLQWEKREKGKNSLAERLETLVNGVVVSELQDINSKIESLCSMGVLKQGPELEELRNKMKQLQTGLKHDNNEQVNN